MCNREISSRRIDWFFPRSSTTIGGRSPGGSHHPPPPLHWRRWQNTEYGRGLTWMPTGNHWPIKWLANRHQCLCGKIKAAFGHDISREISRNPTQVAVRPKRTAKFHEIAWNPQSVSWWYFPRWRPPWKKFGECISVLIRDYCQFPF